MSDDKRNEPFDPLDDIFGSGSEVSRPVRDPAHRPSIYRAPEPEPSIGLLPSFDELEFLDDEDRGDFVTPDIDDIERGDEPVAQEAEVAREQFDVTNAQLDDEVLDLLESSTARMLNVIPLRVEGNRVYVVAERAHDIELLAKLRPLFAGKSVILVEASGTLIRRRIDQVYSASREADRVAAEAEQSGAPTVAAPESGQDLGRVGTIESSQEKVLRLIIEQAIRAGASDIHIEPTGKGLIIRNRVDGKLRVVGHYSIEMEKGLTTLVKVQSNMRADNRRMPDSGVMIWKPKGAAKAVDIRVETSPTVWGQTVVMRLQNEIWRDLSTLGFLPENEKKFRQAISESYGLILVTGPTGSGKAEVMSTYIPTPEKDGKSGVFLRDLKVGDEVFGRDGKVCRVTALSPIDETPELYRLTFSDGQVVLADRDHQWLVSSHNDRSTPRRTKRKRAIERYEKAHRDADRLEALSETAEDICLTRTELFDYLVERDLTGEYVSAYAVNSALDATDCPRNNGTRLHAVSYSMTREQPVILYPTRKILHHITTMKSERALTAKALLDSGDFPEQAGCVEIGRWFNTNNTLARKAAIKLGIQDEGVASTFELSYEAANQQATQVVEYPLPIALKSLALRLRERFHTPPSKVAQLTRMTTGEMLAVGIHLNTGHSNFATPLPKALELPEADLPVPPYTLGAWLGDGSRHNAALASADPEIIENIVADGYPVRRAEPCSKNALVYYFDGLNHDIKSLFSTPLSKPIPAKYIPAPYLRASYEQRLAVLQGLMDTDGTIGKQGACELSLSDKRLATDALELIRSLGIKASCSWDRPAAYRDTDGEPVECKDRHRIKFTTTAPVFRLARKAERLPETTRETTQWNYIVSVEKMSPKDPDYEPARCISVDSDDHTYLCGDGFVVTSNTTTLYSSLRERIHPDTKIVTLENPVEFKIEEGVTQVSVSDEQGMTFGRGLRSIVRQDPDVVLVGEIRDQETAEVAIDAAMTGHLVFSTLHTNDAVGAVPRMTRLGVEPFLLSSSLIAVVAQRLVRRLCVDCRIPAQAEVFGEMHDVFEPNDEGCSECFAGYSGRLPIHEVFMLNNSVRDLVATDPELSVLTERAIEEGLVTMRDDGFQKALQGLTSVTEVLASTRV